jgi:uncharacterized membrane protein
MNQLPLTLQYIVRCFVAGTLMVLPLIITVVAIAWATSFLDQLIGPNTPLGRGLSRLGFPFAGTEFGGYVAGCILTLLVVFGLGMLAELGAKRFMQGVLDSILGRIPLLGWLYSSVRQVVMIMEPKETKDLKAMTVVFCDFGGINGAAFLALLPTPKVFRVGEVDYHAVLIPTAPVPVGGSLIFVPVSSVRKAEMSVDAFMSIYVSMGVTGPQFIKSPPAAASIAEPR